MAPIKEECPICHQIVSMLLSHVKKNHDIMNRKEFIIQHFYSGKWPECQCGCGEKLIMREKKPYFMFKYITGHNSKGTGNPMYGKHFSDDVKEKMRKSAYKRMEIQEEKLGYLPMHSPEALKKRGESQTQRYIEMVEKSCNIKIENTEKRSGIGYYTVKCCKCSHIFKKFHDSTILCPLCFPSPKSSIEEELYVFLVESTNKLVTRNNRSILNDNRELDFYIPDYNLAIEIDGLYYHGELHGNKNSTYHISKTIECEKQNIQLIHIFEDEWVNNKEMIKSRLLYKIGKSLNKKISARKCQIKTVSFKDSQEFLNKNHLQGADKSKFRYGLYYQDILISFMSFAKPNASRGNKKQDDGIYELMRFATKSDTICVGGFGKLFNYFINEIKPEKVISFADRRWCSQTNNIYVNMGFNFIGLSQPSYWYFKENSKRYHRFNFTKKKTIKMGGDSNKTEWQNMQNMGFDRIWDCGSLKYEYLTPTPTS